MPQFDRELFNLQFEPQQPIEFKGRMLFFKTRTRDGAGTLIFEDLMGLPETMSQQEFLIRQTTGEVRLLTPAEVAGRVHEHAGGRPRVGFDSSDREQDAHAVLTTQRILRYINGWERAGCPSRTSRGLCPVIAQVADETGDQHPPSVGSLNRWIRTWLEFERDPVMLVPQRLNSGNFEDRFPIQARNLLSETVHEHYLTEQRLTGVAVHAHVARAFGEYNAGMPDEQKLAVPSLKAVYREIHNIDAFTRDFCRLGKRVAEMRHRYICSGPETGQHNERWEIDHTVVDCLIIDGITGEVIGRPTVTVIIDRHTRMIMGFHISFERPGTASVMEALRMAVLPKEALLAQYPEIKNRWPVFGKCMVLVPDKGAEFRGAAFIEACMRLGMDVQYTPVLKPWYKGTIERFFRTLAVKVFHRVPGTVFSNLYERNGQDTPERTAVLTLDELRFYVLQYIVDVYQVRKHRGLDMSPKRAWTESVAAHGMLPPPNPDDLGRDLANFAYVTIQREGIKYKGLYFRSHELSALRVRAMRPRAIKIKIDPLDMTRIWFIDPFDNQPKEAAVQDDRLNQVRSLTWEKWLLAQAIKRNDPEKFDGDDGMTAALTLLDEHMQEKTRASGRDNRQLAAAYFEKLMRVQERDEVPAFDMGRSSTSLFADAFTDKSDTPASDDPASELSDTPDVERSAVRAPNDPKPKKQRRDGAGGPKRTARTPEPTSGPAAAADEDEEFDPAEYARKHGLNVRERE